MLSEDIDNIVFKIGMLLERENWSFVFFINVSKNKKTALEAVYLSGLVEAAGIEPASENDQHKASTGLGSISSFTQRIATNQAASELVLLLFHDLAEETHPNH